MAGIGNNLYPPIFNKTYMPAFLKNSGCRIYFSISVYNSLSDINEQKGVQIIVQDQKTNFNVLKSEKYPAGVKITNINIDSSIDGLNRYYVELENKDIEGGFNYSQYYKVQIRFISSELKTIPERNEKVTVSWLNNNLDYFSQWSTVILIKPISQPNLILNNFSKGTLENVFNLTDVFITGRVDFQSGDDQFLKSYRINIYDERKNIVEDSGQIYTNVYLNPNEIQYKCKYNFETDVYYFLVVHMVTKNLYTLSSEQYKFKINFIAYTNFDAQIKAIPDNLGGRVLVTIENDILSTFGTNVVIRRCSSKDNFKIWKDVFTLLVPPNEMVNIKWYDYTVESGVWYLYRAQSRNKMNYRSTFVEIKNPIMPVFEDIFLCTKDNQLKIKFDPQVTNFSNVVSESLVQTIGSKYPFIRRNGNVKYRTFVLSGTISVFMDLRQNTMHCTKAELYENNASLYENYDISNNISLYNDSIYERDFRQKVFDFFYENSVKLYKSTTQGNMLVKLMNFSFTPNNSLSRHIYSFSCTVYEIDDFTYQNCIKYNIQEEGYYQDQISFYIESFGQVMRPSLDIYYKQSGEGYNDRIYSNQTFFGTKNLLENEIKEKYKKLITDTVDISISYLSYVKIQLDSPPYLIGSNSTGSLYKITNEDSYNNVICAGHILTVNGKDIIIGKNGIYQLNEEDTKIVSLSFKSNQERGSISYLAVINEKQKEVNIPNRYSNFYKIGQLWGSFSINDSIYTQIKDKYEIAYSEKNKIEQSLQKIIGLRIYADPNTTVYIKEQQDKIYQKHIIGNTGLLEFFDDDTDIRGIYFVGPHLIETQDEDNDDDNKFYNTQIIVQELKNINNPKKNHVYYVLNSDETSSPYIYYMGGWYALTEENDVKIDEIPAIIDYYCSIVQKGY